MPSGRWKACLTAALVLLGGLLGLASGDTFRRGDANADGNVDIADGIDTLNVLFAGATPGDCTDAMDANDSGTVDLADPIYTLNFIFAGGPVPPAPGPEKCGVDPTEDELRCLGYEACPGAEPPLQARDDFLSTPPNTPLRFEADALLENDLARSAVFIDAAWERFAAARPAPAAGPTTDDLLFLHHSIGRMILENEDRPLRDALLARDYVDEQNDIYYDDAMPPDPGRPRSLRMVPGDHMDMHHWPLWFNDYFQRIKTWGCADGVNRIILFKSGYATCDVGSDGREPGDPFAAVMSVANYKAVYRHPDGPGNVYGRDGFIYKPLEDVFAENPDTLFIPVTAPPFHRALSTDANAHRMRVFANWLKTGWLAEYNRRHPDLRNVAVFDLFDVLAYPDTHAEHPNRLRIEYSWAAPVDSHPNPTGLAAASDAFASDVIETGIVSFTAPAHGGLLDNGDGTYTYTPHAGYRGPDRFTYILADGIDVSEPAVVTIDVTEGAEDSP